MKDLALFDFDDTLTTRDTLIEFLVYYAGKLRFYTGLILLSPVMISYKLKLIPNWRAKEILISHFIKGHDQDDFHQVCERFATEIVPALYRPQALAKLDWHKKKGDDIYIVSASPSDWLTPAAADLGVGLISSKLASNGGRMTGKLDGKNCHGIEKANRIKQQLDLSDYNEIYAYGDSSGDTEMLQLATKRFYREF